MKSNFQQLAAEWADLNQQVADLTNKRDAAAEPLNEAAACVLAARQELTYGGVPMLCDVHWPAWQRPAECTFDLLTNVDGDSAGTVTFTVDELEADDQRLAEMAERARIDDLRQMRRTVAMQVAHYEKKLREFDVMLAELGVTS